MKKILAFLSSTFIASSTLAGNFEVGQVWEYKTRPNEKESRLIIVKIDTLKDEQIFHLSLTGLRMKHPEAAPDYIDLIAHLPISKEDLESSVVKLVDRTDSYPPYENGYQNWKKDFDAGIAGYWEFPVAKCVEYMEASFNK